MSKRINKVLGSLVLASGLAYGGETVALSTGWNLVAGPVTNLTFFPEVQSVFTKDSLGLITSSMDIGDAQGGWVLSGGETYYYLEDSTVSAASDYASVISSGWNLLGAPVDVEGADLQAQSFCNNECQIFKKDFLGLLTDASQATISAGEGFWLRAP